MILQKLTTAEKKLIRAVVEWYKYCNQSVDENDIRAITGNNNMTHRDLVQDYIEILTNK